MNENKIYSANDVLIMLDNIEMILLKDSYIQTYLKIKNYQQKLVEIRDE